MEKIRTFIAHPVPEQWKIILSEAFAELRRGLKSRISWVKPENMHFTLKFIGEVPEQNIDVLHTALQRIPFAPFDISAGNPGFFPGPDKPHVIWIGLNSGARKFCANASAVDRLLGQMGYAENPKSCHAHLTLGRIKKQAGDDWGELARRIGKIAFPPEKISSFKLYRSQLTPEGPVYSVLHSYGEELQKHS